MKLKVIFSSSVFVVFIILSTISIETTEAAKSQEPIFELPVQLVGFPVIILAVRLTNFVKKLAYSVNPKTYQSRARRSSNYQFESTPRGVDIELAAKQILEELGPKACVLEEPCMAHAMQPTHPGDQPDWNDILKHYKVQRPGMKQWYLLSVFLGDVIRDTSLCKRLSKRLQCDRTVRKAFHRQ